MRYCTAVLHFVLQSEIPPHQHKTRAQRKARKRAILDVDYTEIPAQVFNAWLKDPSDIVKDTHSRTKVLDQLISPETILYTQICQFISQVHINIHSI